VIQVNKKTIYIIVAILAVVIVAVAAAALLMTTEEEQTPAPEPQTIADGDSLQFTVADSTTGLDYYCAINDFTGETDIVRVDMAMDGECYSYILNLADSTSYASTDFGETWTKSKFADDSLYLEMAYGFATELQDNWDGLSATHSFTAGDISYTISDIKVNELDDSLFATS